MAKKESSTDPKYNVGSPYYFEYTIDPGGALENTISIKGRVVYNDGDYAVVKISSRDIEFEGMVHYLDETLDRFPDFNPDYVPDNEHDEYAWISMSQEGLRVFILNDEFLEYNDLRHDDIDYRIEGCNIPPYLHLHPTSHPKIVFAGGDLFGAESRSRFDGFIAYAERGGFKGYAEEVLGRGWLQCPYRIYSHPTDAAQVRKKFQRNLNYLAGQGCRRIGIHAPEDWRRCKIAIRAAVDWLNAHPDAVDKLYFVDASDDYFTCFGLDSFGKDQSVSNPSPTEFESYYEHSFLSEMDEAFGPLAHWNQYYAYIVLRDDIVKKKHWRSFPTFFSVSLFYTVLVPQAIAKISGELKDMYAFVKLSQWPMMDRYMGGSMAPYTFLADTGLLPKRQEDVEAWFRLAREEIQYFFRVLIHFIIGGIHVPETRPFHLDDQQIKAVRQEMKQYLNELEKCLKDGSTINNYYLPDKILHQQI